MTKVLDNDRYIVEDLPGGRRSQKPYKGIHPPEHLKLYYSNVQDSDSDD